MIPAWLILAALVVMALVLITAFGKLYEERCWTWGPIVLAWLAVIGLAPLWIPIGLAVGVVVGPVILIGMAGTRLGLLLDRVLP